MEKSRLGVCHSGGFDIARICVDAHVPTWVDLRKGGKKPSFASTEVGDFPGRSNQFDVMILRKPSLGVVARQSVLDSSINSWQPQYTGNPPPSLVVCGAIRVQVGHLSQGVRVRLARRDLNSSATAASTGTRCCCSG